MAATPWPIQVGFEDVEALGDARRWAHLAGVDLEAGPSRRASARKSMNSVVGTVPSLPVAQPTRRVGRFDEAQRRLGLGPPEVADRIPTSPT